MQHIIIADDSRTSRMFIRRCLEIIGLPDASFYEVSDGKKALARVHEEPQVDLLITDLNMPEMDGETLLKKVKEDPKSATLPVLVVTSAGNPVKEEQLKKMGAYGILNKPVSPAALLSVLEPLIQG